MSRWLRWLVPIAVVAVGITGTVAGFAYDLAFAGLPYQDPTQEMESSWRYHSRVASVIELVGVVTTLFGMASLGVVAVWSVAGRQAQQSAPRDEPND